VHELAVCQGLIDQIEHVARAQHASTVHAVVVAVGALSGVEAELLQAAFVIARAGTVAAQAQLRVDSLPARVACEACGQCTEVPVNRLLCPACGTWRVRVVGGEELTLMQVELSREVDVDAMLAAGATA
jgi:hydrogenase nickel incorporation protein HypA/HybF